MLRVYDDIKEAVKNLETSTVYQKFQYIYKPVLSYCLKCRKNTENSSPKVANTNKGKLILLSKCAVKVISRFIQEQQARGLLCSLGLKTVLNFRKRFKIPLFKDTK